MSKKLNIENFILKARKIHGDEYCYEKTVYKDIKTKVQIKHSRCGKLFHQRPNSHLSGNGCPYCHSICIKSNTENFIKKAIKVHSNEYDYTKVRYTDAITCVQLKHNKCGKWFWQIPNSHLKGHGCDYCGGSMKLTKDVFIKNAIKIHGNKYDYTRVDYVGVMDKVEIKHNKCGKYFLQTPNNHLHHQGCPYCNSSKLELITEKYLMDRKIVYEIQKRYKNCRDKYPLPFDFYLSELNILIECNGEQHYKPVNKIKGINFTKEQALERFEDRIKKDTIKRNYAKENEIKLIEISYKDIKRIPDILDSEFDINAVFK